MSAINNDWAEALKEEYRKPYYRELYKKINEEYRTREIFLHQMRFLVHFI